MLALALLLGTLAAVEEPASTPAAAVSATTDDERVPYPIPEPTPLALEYHRTGNYLWAFARVWDAAVPLFLLISGTSARLRDFARRVGRNWYVGTALYLVTLVVIVFLADLPLRYYSGFVRQHAYGLSRQTFAKWSTDSFLGLGVEAVGVAAFAWVPFWVIGRLPRWWWLVMSLAMVPFTAFVALVQPVLIDPLFNHYGPMKDPVMEARILALAERAGISGGRVFEVDKSVDTKAVNAYVKGVLGTHRIVLWDTLLKEFDEGEVLVVMGHEMGHYVLHHIEWGIALSSLLLVAGLFFVDRAGRWVLGRYGPRLGIASLSDVAAAPLLLLLMGISSIVLGPVALAYSRSNERAADRFSLELTHLNRTGARTFAHFQRENLGIPQPSWPYTVWRATHPSVAERITFFNTYRPSER